MGVPRQRAQRLNQQTTLHPSIYFCHIQGAPVLSAHGERIGYLEDLFVSSGDSPRIVGLALKDRGGRRETHQWESVTIREEDFKYTLISRSQEPRAPEEAWISLRHEVLDQQIVDINGRKVVRVNDIRLAFLASGFFPVAVDVGWSGLFRRIGMLDAANWLLKLFDRSIPGRLILWNDIGVLAPQNRNIKLGVSSAKLTMLHPSDLSDIIEDLDAKTRTAVFRSLDYEKAADVLVEMEDEAAASLVEDLPVEQAADVLEQMPSDEVADLLDDLDEKQAERLLEHMDQKTSNEVRELMEYPENTAGALMTTDVLAFPAEETIGRILEDLRRARPDDYAMYSIFAVDQHKRLLGVAGLTTIVTAPLDAAFASVMDDDPQALLDTDDIDSLLGVLTKYNMHSVPVVSADRTLVGAIIIDDVIYRMFRSKRVEL